MMNGIRLPICCKNSAVLLSILLLVGCQPPTNDIQPPSDGSEQVKLPVTINADSVTMAPEYILSIKPSRYQPSLGLQGVIEPVKQSRFVTTRDITVQKVLVKEGQWVEEGTPLLIVQPQAPNGKGATTATDTDTDTNDSINNKNVSENSFKGTETDNEQTTSPDGISEADNKADNAQTNTNTNTDETEAENNQSTPSPKSSVQPIVIRASFSGRIEALEVKAAQQVSARKPLLRISDDKDLRFIATLPMEAKSQLSVGQSVNFTPQGLTKQFAGQVSKLVASDQPDKLQVYVHVVKNEESVNKLKSGMAVTGRVDYGQIEVGTIVPEHGIHDVNLSVLQKPPYQSLMPLIANVWVIQQDQRLTRQPVEVIKYDPTTNQYLIAGVSNDSLICLADLPTESVGKKVIVS